MVGRLWQPNPSPPMTKTNLRDLHEPSHWRERRANNIGPYINLD